MHEYIEFCIRALVMMMVATDMVGLTHDGVCLHVLAFNPDRGLLLQILKSCATIIFSGKARVPCAADDGIAT